MKSIFKFRPANLQDEAEVKFLAEVDMTIPAKFDKDFVINEQMTLDRAKFLKSVTENDFFELALDEDKKIVGFHLVKKVPHFDKFAGRIDTLWVSPEFRKHGLASDLKTHAEVWAAEHKLDHLHTWVHSDNVKMISINRRMGYKIVNYKMRKDKESFLGSKDIKVLALAKERQNLNAERLAHSHVDFYSKAKYYDIAFSFKNVPEENQAVLDTFLRHNKRNATSFLDIGAGPASNAIEMAKRGLKSNALDYSTEMVVYGIEKANSVGTIINYLQGDMRSFELPEPVDLAAIFMDSTSYLLTNDDVINHLRSVARCLKKDGLYLLEMSHPRDVFSVGKSANTEWTEKQNDIEVSVKWGDDSDRFDPIKQTTMVTATLKFKTPSEQGEIVDRSEQRCFTFNEIDALVKASGCFEVIDVIGSLKPGVPFSNDKACWRMIPVLRKKS